MEFRARVWTTVNTLIEMTSATGARVGELQTAYNNYHKMITCLDLQKISEEYLRVLKVATEISSSEGVRAELKVAENLLDGWQGAAKNEFLRQMSRIDTFLISQGDGCREAVRSLSALYASTFHVRETLFSLNTASLAAANDAIDDKNKKNGRWT